MTRVRVYDAEDLAIGMVETFNDRPWEYVDELPFSWPNAMQNVGDSLAVAYSSDKWKPKGKRGKRAMEPYKHLSESRNRVLVRRGLLKDFYRPNRSVQVRGPMVSLIDCPLPQHFAILGLFEEANLHLYMGGTKEQPEFSDEEDDGVVKVTVRHGMLGGSYIMWPNGRTEQPFLFVYTESGGVLMLIVGEELDVEKDGIVG